jgi:hypothetical protein
VVLDRENAVSKDGRGLDDLVLRTLRSPWGRSLISAWSVRIFFSLGGVVLICFCSIDRCFAEDRT